MTEFHITYRVTENIGSEIQLNGAIERPTLREALAEFYDECGSWLLHVQADKLDISEPTADGGYITACLCPECLGNDAHCMLCGGDGVAPEGD